MNFDVNLEVILQEFYTFFVYERKIVLTNGFVKKTIKTPVKQIQTAKVRRIDFLERMEQDENI